MMDAIGRRRRYRGDREFNWRLKGMETVKTRNPSTTRKPSALETLSKPLAKVAGTRVAMSTLMPSNKFLKLPVTISNVWSTLM
jgi:hypothetical protein